MNVDGVLLKPTPGRELPGTIRDLLEQLERDTPRSQRILCPHCGWQPRPSDRWSCVGSGPPEHYDGCGTCWNTFSTRGLCPGCDHQWRWTCCPACSAWSRHEDWYVRSDSD